MVGERVMAAGEWDGFQLRVSHWLSSSLGVGWLGTRGGLVNLSRVSLAISLPSWALVDPLLLTGKLLVPWPVI